MESVAVTLGGSPTGQLTLRPVRREYPDASAPDVNWIFTRVTVAAGAFRGEVDALMYIDDFVRFRDAVRPLYDDLGGKALFATPEEWVRIEVEGDGRGHFTARCVVRDQPGSGNHLTFELELDQTELPAILQALDAICESFPVR
jgi:hypothetical protein